MTPEQDGREHADEPREVQLTSFALDQLDAPQRDEVVSMLAADAASQKIAADTASIAGALRKSHDASELPPPSPELHQSLITALSATNEEDQVVKKSPETISTRRRFSALEIILSIAVLCLGTTIVLMNARQQPSHLADSRTNLVDDSKSMLTSDEYVTSQTELVRKGIENRESAERSYGTNGQSSASSAQMNQPLGETFEELGDTDDLTVFSASPGLSTSGDPKTSPTRGVNLLPESTRLLTKVTHGLDPYDRPTSGLDVEFREGEFGVAVPAFGGFDADKDGIADAEWFERGGGDQYARIYDNAFKTVSHDPLSTFSIDVDTASYSKMRQHILEHGQLPPPDAVRIEELLNYFPYDYLEPMDEHPFAAHMEVAQCPWKAEHRLARIAIKGKEMKPDARPASNLVFLVDVSGSMNEANKLPLVKRGLEMLTRELTKNDRVAIVCYAGAAGLVLPSTSGDEQETILAALGKLEAGGSTAGAEGINLAYQTAEENFIHAGVNRVILCTDGDFNVGVSDTGSLVRLAEEQAKKNIFLSILGFGIGNLNDEMLEQVSNKANGMYAFIDTENEARKVLVEQMSGTLVTIAKDVKIQIEFNPAKVAAYRLIGYENRILAAEDFNDDKKDAGEIGAGHTVTALYEIVPVVAKEKPEIPTVDELKYQRPSELTDAAESDELLTLKLRYKSPEGDKSTLLSEPIDDSPQAFGKVSDDFKFAAAVASFGMLLRGSEYAGDATMDAVLEIATDGAEHDPWGYRKEFLEIVKRAKELKK